MTTKNLIVLTAVAAVLCGAAYLSRSGKRMKAPSLAGKPVLQKFDLSQIAKVEIGGTPKVKLSAGDAGWKVDSLYGYPADVTKIRENLLRLQDLKVGQVIPGKKLAQTVLVDLQDAAGKSLATATLGDSHMRQASGQMAQFGGGSYPDGRYLKVKDQTVLVNDPLEAFDGDPKRWVSTSIASVPSANITAIQMARGDRVLSLSKKDGSWKLAGVGEKEEFDTSKMYSIESALSSLNFSDVVDPAKKEDALGLTTGSVYTVMLKNGQVYTAKIGNTREGGSDRYIKLNASFSPTGTNATENAALKKEVETFNASSGKWIYTIPSYAAENMVKARKDLVKAKESPKSGKSALSEPVALPPKSTVQSPAVKVTPAAPKAAKKGDTPAKAVQALPAAKKAGKKAAAPAKPVTPAAKALPAASKAGKKSAAPVKATPDKAASAAPKAEKKLSSPAKPISRKPAVKKAAPVPAGAGKKTSVTSQVIALPSAKEGKK